MGLHEKFPNKSYIKASTCESPGLSQTPSLPFFFLDFSEEAKEAYATNQQTELGEAWIQLSWCLSPWRTFYLKFTEIKINFSEVFQGFKARYCSFFSLYRSYYFNPRDSSDFWITIFVMIHFESLIQSLQTDKVTLSIYHLIGTFISKDGDWETSDQDVKTTFELPKPKPFQLPRLTSKKKDGTWNMAFLHWLLKAQ